MSDPVMSVMRAQRRWLVASPDKVPFYITGQKRNGALDGPADTDQLATYDDAKAVVAARGNGWHLGFALGPDGTGGHWQGIDLDKIVDNRLADLANTVPGYVEMSPSGTGAHAIGYGRHFVTLGSNGTGIEAYAGGRYFTVTERLIRDDGLICLAAHVEQVLAPRHGAGRAASVSTEQVSVDPKTVTELRSALLHMRSDDRDLWVAVGQALKELSDAGRGLWMEWSATSDKFDPKDAAKKWAGFDGSKTGYRAVFAKAQAAGWVNPASNAAQPDAVTIDLGAPPAGRKLVGRSLSGVKMRAIEWLWTGWIPKGYITLFAGETGAGKSTVLGDVTARITTGKPWPAARR